MAQKRAQIVTTGLEDLHTPIAPIRNHETPVEAPSEFSGDDTEAGATILEGFASLRPAAKRERMVPYPIRLPVAQIEALEQLKRERGVVPAEFIRDAVASCLALLRE